MKSGQWSVVGGQWKFSRRVHAALSGARGSGFGVRQVSNPQSLIPNPSRSAFTLVEMLVVITIIGILAAMSFGALQLARESARERSTQATIAKLNNVIMRRYESYVTRRVPIRIPPGTTPHDAAEIRLAALRDLMRMEMPERWNDVSDTPGLLPHFTTDTALPEPALHLLYRNKYAPGGTLGPNSPNAKYSHAKCLFMLISMGSPEAMEQFNQSEIAVDSDGWQYFVDGWGKPIYFLRWAPGCSSTSTNGYSDIQTGNATTDHDPFDTRKVDANGFHLIPLIFSFGRGGNASPNVSMEPSVLEGAGGVRFRYPDTNMVPLSIVDFQQTIPSCYPYRQNGEAANSSALGNITNHHIEQR